ncbi:Transcriptional regulator, DeoR family [Candidatus Burkholderia verschuerenii]|uniref:Transcriptional regulator, DeoR family n=1 Tax=Candidatus Burkholderia verschuerenii TaxID=242163 RepID=A0A0L0MF19_9BURK|nr:DeoR/GlpR family DNA-binding transcription regulator [Candidatus Burkholderia verschuerenii]KND61282.1 Transcriptional regulator, DeoR family [Candidatus Burkholderia verschuerenii]
MNNDIPLSRRDEIAERLARGQPVVATALAAEFDISEDAIRRDLRALAAEGRCRRVYGGALPITPASTPMASRIDTSSEQKTALARAAVALIRPGELLFLDSGSTNLALVDLLPEDAHLTVATNSVDIAAAVLRRADLELIMIGGAVDAAVGGSVDANAVQSVARLNFDRCFIGSCAISPERGISAFHIGDAAFKRAVLAASEHSVVLALTEKFDARAPYKVAAIGEIETVVVEHNIAPETRAALSRLGTSVILTNVS